MSPPPSDEDVPTDVFKREDLGALERDKLERTMVDTDAPVGPPPLDVEVMQQRGVATLPQAMWAMLDIYTHNRVYRVSPQLICIDVVDRATGKSHGQHPMLGARLGGGQRRTETRVEISDPIPMPGMEAVFKQPGERGDKFGQTSRVERVVMRLRVSAWSASAEQPTSWAEITSEFAVDDVVGRRDA
ncbi:MAG: hypothetical protein IT374_17320 [Polyangiaceae bacterium]|nr:hypothetical protein [Polyangiaceae bacterium]